MTYLDCWISSATALFSQALAGEPELVDSLPRPTGATMAFTATVSGDQEGRFTVILDRTVLDTPLLGEGVEQESAWSELLREVADAAVGELLAKTGNKCRVDRFEPSNGEDKVSRAFQLKSGEHAWTVLVRDEVRAPKADAPKSDRPRSAHPRTVPRLFPPASNCCWMLSSTRRCVSGAASFHSARFSNSARAMSSSSTDWSTTPQT